MDLKFVDIAVGTIFIYLLLSLFASTIMELIAVYLKMRAKDLEKTIQRMLDDESTVNHNEKLSKLFYSNPLIKYLAEVKKNEIVKSSLPSYMTNKNFSQALFDEILKIGGTKTSTFSDLLKSLSELEKKYPDSETVRFIRSLERDCQGSVDKFKASLEQWFNDTMERATGWYKRKTQWILLYLGFTIAFLFNADTFQIVKYLSDNPEARTEMVQRAKEYIETDKAVSNLSNTTIPSKVDTALKEQPSASIQQDTALVKQNTTSIKQDTTVMKQAELLMEEIRKQDKAILELGNVIGWKGGFKKGIAAVKGDSWLMKLFGFALTALAISLGAAFWFDLLKKLINIRGAGRPESKVGVEENRLTSPVAPPPTGTQVDAYRILPPVTSAHQVATTPKPGDIKQP